MKLRTSLKRILSRKGKPSQKDQPQAESRPDTLVVVRNLEDGSRLVQIHLKDERRPRSHVQMSSDRRKRRMATLEEEEEEEQEKEEGDPVTPVPRWSQRDTLAHRFSKVTLTTPPSSPPDSHLPISSSPVREAAPRIIISPGTPPSPRTCTPKGISEAGPENKIKARPDSQLKHRPESEFEREYEPESEPEPEPGPEPKSIPNEQHSPESESRLPSHSSLRVHMYRPKLRPQPDSSWERKRKDTMAHLAQANLLLDQMQQEDSYTNLIRIFTSELFGEEYKEVEATYRELPEFGMIGDGEHGREAKEKRERNSWSSTVSSLYRTGLEAGEEAKEGRDDVESTVRSTLATYQWGSQPAVYEGT
ncbi:hypothetical protein K431DRAFT_303901 [Polychaeton citri CBS 116435]|uniref:Uncharacterized protein n=1 Tax=Polychaeton citri CBS 116435 TaxID=1314669 RepID=A0A9P4Q5P9_9PEZI|nr:hypothetical protein K431DRAFT_303901 [Polychaeton citri CBS 116435]